MTITIICRTTKRDGGRERARVVEVSSDREPAASRALVHVLTKALTEHRALAHLSGAHATNLTALDRVVKAVRTIAATDAQYGLLP